MQNLDWNDIRYFLAVVKCGSVSAASKALKVNHTTVSRRITALEQNLETKLFNRSTSGWKMTLAGMKISPIADIISEQANIIRRHAISTAEDLRGTVRITSGNQAFRTFLLPVLKDLNTDFPEIKLELIASQSIMNLENRDADIAVRFGPKPPDTAIANRISELEYAIYGTREFTETASPLSPGENTTAIMWLSESPGKTGWVKQKRLAIGNSIHVDDISVMLDLAISGVGIARLPCMLGDSQQGLTRIADYKTLTPDSVWVLSHVDLRATARVRVVRDAIVVGLRTYRDLFEGRRPQVQKEQK